MFASFETASSDQKPDAAAVWATNASAFGLSGPSRHWGQFTPPAVATLGTSILSSSMRCGDDARREGVNELDERCIGAEQTLRRSVDLPQLIINI